ncbi:hypothetical protein CEE44_00130 [Candidatus Woesearchaeota archaeon B3_Woes]|nr:MAG: hypothetical protein CEE44_00130 [Candidatus Woesearchaeota archaeon B3_Woes]
MDIKQPSIKLEDRVLSRHERFENWLLKRYKTITVVTCGVGIFACTFSAYNLGTAVHYLVKEDDPRASVSENSAFKEDFHNSFDYFQKGFFIACGSLFLSTLAYYEGRRIAREREEESNSY